MRSAGCYDRCFCTDDLITDFGTAATLGVVAGVVEGLPQPVRNLWTATGTGSG